MSYPPIPTTIRKILRENLSLLPLKLNLECWGVDRLSNRESTSENLPELTLKINHPGVIKELVLSRDPLILAEAYLAGYLDFFGEVEDLMRFEELPEVRVSVAEAIRAWLEAFSLPATPESLGERTPWKQFTYRTATRDRMTVQFHYDLSNDFYGLCLDPLRVYSCAHFEHPDMSLQAAQEAKLDLICRKLKLQEGDYLLDIGCGWGGLLYWAVTRYNVKGYGITLSKEQLAFNQQRIENEGLGDRLNVELRHYQELADKPTFDKIVSIGMVEHVGVEKLPIYFQKALKILKPGGLFLNHGMTVPDKYNNSPNVRFIQRYIFPDVDLCRVSEMQLMAEEQGWEIVDVDAWRPSYGKTSRCWAENLEATLDKAIALVGERKARIWQLYMIGMAQAFERNGMGVYQVLHRRKSELEWDLPWSRHGWLC